jgi:hypothetical protein
MRILITNSSLAFRTGTELIVTELAVSLLRRGHQVVAYSSRLGEAAELLREATIPVIDNPIHSPFVPDIIHGQHHLDAMTALLAFPSTPAIYHCHGGFPWLERPPLHPRILHYAAMCEILAELIRVERNLATETVSAVPNWVDLDRIPAPQLAASAPRRVLIFHSQLPHNRYGDAIRSAAQSIGLEVVTSAEWTDAQKKNPPQQLSGCDIVFASGRSALEAAAAGCAVICVSPESTIGWAWPENFTEMRRKNFSPRQGDAKITTEQIKALLADYDAQKSNGLTELVRRECTLDKATDQLVEIYDRVVADWSKQPPPTADQERLALMTYLRGLSTAVREVEWLPKQHEKESGRLKATIQDLKQQLSQSGKAELKLQTLRQSWLGRLALKMLR